MTEVERIADQLKRALDGPAWHGPSLREALDGVTAQAAARPPATGRHTIWELVLHVTAWVSIARRRLAGEVFEVEQDGERDWPRVGETSDATWRSALAVLREEHARLERVLLEFGDARLDQAVGGREASAYVLAHGAIQHDLYHAGQIAILKRAL